MRRLLIPLAFTLAVVTPDRALAQGKPTQPQRMTVPEWHLAPVPKVLYTHLPQLPRDQGLVVNKIVTGTPLERINVQQFDILLSYDGQALRSAEQFYRLTQTAKPEHKAPLTLVRGGKEMTLDVVLTPATTTTPYTMSASPPANIKGALKPGGPPAVAIECTPLDDGKLQVILGYYMEHGSKLQTQTYEGSLVQIEQQVRDSQLPARVQELVDVAIKRLKKTN